MTRLNRLALRPILLSVVSATLLLKNKVTQRLIAF